MRSLAFVAVIVSLAVAAPALGRPLQLADYLQWKTAGGAQVSPDGRRIVFAETRVVPENDSYDALTYVMNADGTGRRFLLDGALPRWSPQGDRLAFTAREGNRRQIFVRDMTNDAAQPVAITHGDLYPSQIAWSPDGKWIAFAAAVPAPPADFQIELPARPAGAKWQPEAIVIDSLNYRGMTGGLRRTNTHIFVVPSQGGEPRELTVGNFSVGARLSGLDWGRGFVWSPDGRSILFDGLTTPDSFATGRFSAIQRVDVATGAITTVSREKGFWLSPRPSPNGRLIAYFGNGDDRASWPRRELRVMDADGGHDRVLVEDLPDEPGVVQWAPDGSGVYLNLNARGRTNLRFVSLSGAQREVTRGPWRLSVSSFSTTGLAVATRETPREAGDIVGIDLRTGEVRRLTEVNTVLTGVDLADVEELSVRSADGTPIQAWLMRPPGAEPGRSYPMILDIHGGPHSMVGEGFDFRYQAFAAHGYAVLWVNPRGSTGYGHAFANAIDGAFPGPLDSSDLLAAVDAAVARGSIDTQRLYVMGCSGGGSLTEWLIGHTDRFAAAVVMCPVSDWISLAGTTDVVAWGQTRFAKPYWEDPAPWLEHSPLMYVGNVKTPTLVMTGDQDYRTPRGQAEEYYAALSARGVPTKLVIVQGETHQPWKGAPSNLLRTQLYIEKWFQMYAKRRAAQ